MARPTKAVTTMSRHNTKKEIQERLENETKLKGNSDKLKPPSYLTLSQRKIFKYIIKELETSEILGNLDVFILTQCAISIDRLQTIEQKINDNIMLLCDSAFMASKNKYTSDLFRCVNELSLSPQARAKIGNMNLNKKEKSEDPVLKVLSGGKK
jgi:P27 family predicted phage terminase small subunit